MAKARSPEYPAIGLKEAVERVKLIYDKDYQNKVPKAVIAAHMGYKGLNGTSLPVIAALGKYGLLEGRGDETRVSDLALAIIAHPPGSPERAQALRTAATTPELFAELASKFSAGKASDQAIRAYLMTQRFIPTAADTVIRSYRETIQLVETESSGYFEPPKQEFQMQEPPAAAPSGWDALPEKAKAILNMKPSEVKPPDILQEVFNLDEGPVTLAFPRHLSQESYEDLKDQLELFLRRAQRRAEISDRYKDPEYLAKREAEIVRRANRSEEDNE
jgi:hypothetical protein